VNDIAAARARSIAAVDARSVLYLAWAIVLLLTVPEIILRAFMRFTVYVILLLAGGL